VTLNVGEDGFAGGLRRILGIGDQRNIMDCAPTFLIETGM
jgi:hypothetical protein